MKKLLLFLLFIPFLAKAQNPVTVTQPYKFLKWVSAGTTLYVPYGSTPTLNGSPTTDGAIFVKSDSSLYVNISGNWVKLIKANIVGLTTITSGTTPTPLTVNYNSTNISSPKYALIRTGDNTYDWNTNVEWTSGQFIINGDDNGSGKFADSYIFYILP